MATLYDISSDLVALEQLMVERGGDVSDPEIEEAVERWFSELETARDEKLNNYAWLIRELLDRSEARKKQAKRLEERARVDNNVAQNLKERLLWFLTIHGLKSIETDDHRLTRAKAGGKQAIELKAPVDELPDFFVRTEVVKSPDMDKIREALESGVELSFAELKERGEYLRIS